MDASRPIADRIRHPRRGVRAACAVVLGCSVVAAHAGEGVRLPEWREPTPVADRRAPRPKAEDDLARLLVVDAGHPPAPRQDAERDAAVASARPVPLTVRQLEHAASEARTLREIGRLIARCGEARAARSDEASRRRIDELIAWAYAARARRRAEATDPRAGDDFAFALLARPGDYATRHEFAIWLADRGETDRAIAELSRVIDAAPDSRAAVRNRATVALRAGRPSRAAEDASRWIGLLRPAVREDEGELADAFALRGAAWHAAGRLDAAAADLRVALRLRPGDPGATLTRANIYAERGFHEQAIVDYAAAAAHPRTAADAYRALAWLLATCPDARLRDAATAVEAAGRAERLSGATPLVLEASAAAHAAAGQFDRAVRLQQRVVLASGERRPAGAELRLTLYEEGRPFVADGVR